MPELFDWLVGGICGFSGIALWIASRESRRLADRIESIQRVQPGLALTAALQSAELNTIPYAALTGFVRPAIGECALNYSGGNCVVMKTVEKEHKEERSSVSTWYDVVRTIGEAFQTIPFVLSNSRFSDADMSDAILVRASNQELVNVLETADAKFTPANPSFGRAALSLLAGSRVKGYEHITQVLAVGRMLTVLGQLSYVDGQIQISAPSLFGDKFIISTFSVDELVADYGAKARILKFLAALFAVGFLGYTFIRLWAPIKQRLEEAKRKQEMEEFRRQQREQGDVEDAADESMCVICLSQPRSITILECGHLCVCASCASQLGQLCPVCRGRISRTLRTFT